MNHVIDPYVFHEVSRLSTHVNRPVDGEMQACLWPTTLMIQSAATARTGAKIMNAALSSAVTAFYSDLHSQTYSMDTRKVQL